MMPLNYKTDIKLEDMKQRDSKMMVKLEDINKYRTDI